MTHFVKVRKAGEKAWYFLDRAGEKKYRREHAMPYTAEEAERCTAEWNATSQGRLEYKVVPIDAKAGKPAPKQRKYSGGKKGTRAELSRRVAVGARMECLSEMPRANLNGLVGVVRSTSGASFVWKTAGSETVAPGEFTVFLPKRVSDMEWLDADTVLWRLSVGTSYRFKFLPPLPEDDDPAPAESDEQERRFMSLLKLSADTPEQLRKVDAYRVLEAAHNAGCFEAFANWLSGKRNDLAKEITDAADEFMPHASDCRCKRCAKPEPMPTAERVTAPPVAAAKKGPPDEVCYRPALVLPSNLQDLAKLTCKNKRYALDCLNVKSTNRGYRVEATNGLVMVMVSGPNVVEVTNLAKDLPDLANCPNGASTALIPGKAWSGLFKMLPGAKVRKAQPQTDNVAMVLAETGNTCASVAICDGKDVKTIDVPRAGDGRFPNVDMAWPKSRPVATWKVDADMLAELLAVIADLVRDKKVSGTQSKVTLEFHANKNGNPQPVTLVAGNHQGQEIRAAFMPLQ